MMKDGCGCGGGPSERMNRQRNGYINEQMNKHWTRCANNGNIWPKMTKNAYFGPILAVFGPKILILMGVSKSFGTNIKKTTWATYSNCLLVKRWIK